MDVCQAPASHLPPCVTSNEQFNLSEPVCLGTNWDDRNHDNILSHQLM